LHAYQSAERKSGTSAEALKREVRWGLVLEKEERDPGDDKGEQNDIVFFLFTRLSSPLSLVSTPLCVVVVLKEE
jgi:hypothetical protein